MRLPQIKFDKIKEFLKKASLFLAEKAFFTFLGFFSLALIFSSFLFYKNVILANKAQPEILGKPLQFNEKLLNQILKEMENRQRIFEEIEKKQYLDPFSKIISLPEEELTE